MNNLFQKKQLFIRNKTKKQIIKKYLQKKESIEEKSIRFFATIGAADGLLVIAGYQTPFEDTVVLGLTTVGIIFIPLLVWLGIAKLKE